MVAERWFHTTEAEIAAAIEASLAAEEKMGTIRPMTFAADIRPLFRDFDVSSMKRGHLDLSSYADVSAHADKILERLEAGDMPCDGAWPAADVEKFRRWIADGKLP